MAQKINPSLLEKIFLKEAKSIGKVWIKGTYEWLRKYPKAYAKLEQLEADLNKIWGKAEVEKIDLDDFITCLTKWSGFIKKVLNKRREENSGKNRDNKRDS